ncbi:MAG: ribonucleotide reductase N-terminal alpha domain-containing protein [Patescibacteria group bacterium]
MAKESIPKNYKKAKLTESSLRVVEERYLIKDASGRPIESPEEMFYRVAKTVAENEKSYKKTQKEIEDLTKKFYSLMIDGVFLPNSPTLMNVGKNNKLQYSGCFVLPVDDSLEAIFTSVKNAALIHKSGGGTGFSFSRLRPKGASVSSTSGVASGPVSFMRVFDSATAEVKQGGTRRGANMGVLRVDHPDIEEFIQSKAKGGITNFNISVAITDEFLKAYKENKSYFLKDPSTGKKTGRVKAKKIFDKIVNQAWATGDPGVIFIDQVNASSANPVPFMGPVEATNPCLTGDSLVSTENGLIKIKELVKSEQSLKVLTSNNTKQNYQIVEGFWDRGEKEIWKLTTKSGFELRATGDHKIMTERDWVSLSELKEGEDKVVIQQKNREFLRDERFQLKKEKVEGLSDYFQVSKDEVIKIEKTGKKEKVYDLTIQQDNCFFANGILVHNCGEQPLYPNEACNLGSLNLGLMKGVKTDKDQIDWEKLKKATHLAVRFLDNIIDINPFPLEEITEIVLKNRRVGLGVMGWADLLFELEIAYNSSKAFRLGKKIMIFIQKQAHLESQRLAKERGAFKTFEKSIYKKGPKLRNSTLTTIAPTGSISIIAGCSSGIEPLFALCFKHKAGERELTFVNPAFKKAAKKHNVDEQTWKKIEERGTLHDVVKAPKKLKEIFVTAHEINWKDHIKMQAAFQAGTDNAVSKTINLPNDADQEVVRKAYLLAYKSGCMGTTIFRDGCRSEQVLYSGVGEEEKKIEENKEKPTIKPRPKIVSGQTYRVETPVGTAFVTVNTNGGNEPLEIFINVGKAGSDIAADAEAIGRLVSLNLRIGSLFSASEVLAQIIDQLDGIGGGESVGFGPNKVRSLADGVSKVLTEYIHKGENLEKEAQASLESQQLNLLNQKKKRDLCPKCGRATLVFEEGCAKCTYCGFNKC